jgi:hypothetical protein
MPEPPLSSFSGFPVAEVLPLASGDSLVKQPNDVIAGEVEGRGLVCDRR